MASSFLEKGEKTSLPCAPASSGVWHPKEHRGGGLLPGTGGLKKKRERWKRGSEQKQRKQKRKKKGVGREKVRKRERVRKMTGAEFSAPSL